jgi:hypothetical protein
MVEQGTHNGKPAPQRVPANTIVAGQSVAVVQRVASKTAHLNGLGDKSGANPTRVSRKARDLGAWPSSQGQIVRTPGERREGRARSHRCMDRWMAPILCGSESP